MSTIYTIDEVNKHNNENDSWIILDGEVYDITKFISIHPGGKNVFQGYYGKDATDIFNTFHSQDVKQTYSKLLIGRVQDKKSKIIPLHEFPNSDKRGNGYPYGDILSMQGFYSPYYNQSHIDLRYAIRKFCVETFGDKGNDWEEEKKVPDGYYEKFCDQGLMALAMGTPWPKEFYPEQVVCGVKLEKPDSFHELIFVDEMTRLGNSTLTFLSGGNCIGLPPIIKFAKKEIQHRIIGPVLRGEKRICLAITEPWAGSDVAGIKTSAVKTPCKQFYIVNGMKKWITNGIFSDYFTTAVVTDPENGMFGISLLLIEKTMPGVFLRQMKCQALWSTGTTFVIFDNVKVPVSNLIGEENEGFKCIMLNFNHERMFICMTGLGGTRYMIEHIWEYLMKRETFGKKLIDHQVIRQHIAKIINQLSIAQALLEQCCYNYDNMKTKQKLTALPVQLSLLKSLTGAQCEQSSMLGTQIIGGIGYTRTGQGRMIESGLRSAKAIVVLGGSEDIMNDLAIKMASRLMPNL